MTRVLFSFTGQVFVMGYWLAVVLISYYLNYLNLSCSGGYIYGSPSPNQPEAGVARSKRTALSEATYLLIRRRGNEMKDLQLCILKHWIHSHEEDSQGSMVYRPANYSFPPSRGRIGFEFQDGGKLVYYGISRTDGYEQTSGRWLIEASNRVRIYVDNERIQPFVLEVISCDDQVLRVKR